MRKLSFLLVIGLLVALVPVGIGVRADESPWLSEFEKQILETMQQEHIPGLAMAVVDSQGIVFAEGYGLRNVETGAPVTPETLFHIGSTHKSMTAMLVAALVDDGWFDWDTPITTLVPGFSFSDELASQLVSMRHLLSMRAGIPDYAEDDLDFDAPAADVLMVASQTRLFADPGEAFEYSNLSASLAGYLGVLAAGGAEQSLYDGYAHLLEERILGPIGMNSATLSISEAQSSDNFSYSYSVSRSGKARRTDTYDIDGDPLAPAGSLKANVIEMGYYVSTQLNNGVAPNGNRVVSVKNLAETWVSYLENYAMGWENFIYNSINIITHTGAYDDFASVIGFMPDLDVGFVIFVNSEEAGYDLVEAVPYVLADLLGE